MSSKSQYATGTVVRLKSGGPKMTVRREMNGDEGLLNCQWFKGDKLEFDNFPFDSLELVKPEVGVLL